jgi:hypothetical protein
MVVPANNRRCAVTFFRLHRHRKVDPGESGQIVSGQAVIINSHEEVMDAIGVSIRVSGRYALSTASAKFDYSKSTGYNSTSTFVLAKASVVNPIERAVDFQLTDPAKALLRVNDMMASSQRSVTASFVV